MEVRVNGQWGTICDTDFDLADGNIVCKALGYGVAVQPYYRAYYGRGVGPVHYSELR